jgi:large-conductance mechanosensitive channel
MIWMPRGRTLEQKVVDCMTAHHQLLADHPHFLHWGVIQISLANFLVLAVMVVLFVLALIVPFPSGTHHEMSGREAEHDND